MEQHFATGSGLSRCPVCYEIVYEPVVFPCHHEVCLTCFNKSLETANLCCPLCRKRISSWARRNAQNPVCLKRKQQIEEALFIFSKENGPPVESLQTDVTDVVENRCLSKPGEIMEEYLTELQKVQKERFIEETVSVEEVQKLQYEEEQYRMKLETDRRKQEELGEAAARSLAEDEQRQKLYSLQQVKDDEQMAEVLSQEFILKQIAVQQKQVEEDRKIASELSKKNEPKTPDPSHVASPSNSVTTKKSKMASPSAKPITFWFRPLYKF